MQHEAPVETSVLKNHMALIEHMAMNATPDGMPRTPGKLIITSVGEAWLCEVMDPDRLRSIRVLGATLDDALFLADKLVRSASPPWSSISKVRAMV